MENEVPSLFHRLLLGASGNNDGQRRIGRYYFLQTCIAETRRFASHELIARFWKEKKETEGIWLERSTMRVQARISQLIEFLIKNYNLRMEFVAELLQAMEDATEMALIEGLVPYEYCFRPAKAKDYLTWYNGYKESCKEFILGNSLRNNLSNFCVAVHPFKINPNHCKWIVVPEKISAPPPRTLLGGNILFLMKGFELRRTSPKWIPVYLDIPERKFNLTTK